MIEADIDRAPGPLDLIREHPLIVVWTLLALASGLYRTVAHKMRGYADAQARQIFRDLIDMPADVSIGGKEITVSFHRRAHLPILLASGLLNQAVAVPWWNGFALRLEARHNDKT